MGRPPGSPNKPVEEKIERVLKRAALECAKRVYDGTHNQNDTVYLKAYMEKMMTKKTPTTATLAPFAYEEEDEESNEPA